MHTHAHRRPLAALLAAMLLLTAGCKKEEPTDAPQPIVTERAQAYLLNEGAWGGNNAELSLVNLDDGTISADWFSTTNGRGLGDLAQDLIRYGSRLYISVYGSNTVEVVDAASGRSLRQIDFGSRGPRHLAADGGKVYVSCYDRTVARIDTASLAIEATCPLSGMQPEQICIAGGSLYVCNSWQYGDGGAFLYDSTLSVVDLASFTETEKITVGYNPSKIKRLDESQIVVICAGDYASHPAQTLIVNTNSHAARPLSIAATNADTYQGDIYLYSQSYDSQYNPAAAFYRVDGTTLAATPILQAYSSQLSNAYGISVNPANGDLFITNSPYGANGDLYCLSADGTLRWKSEGGIYASKVVFR